MLTLFAVLVLAVVGMVGTAYWIDTKLHRIPALADYPDRPAEGKGTTWLLVGSDSRQGLTPEQQIELGTGGDIGNGHTDTIMLVHVPALWSDTPTTMVSIPRDSYVEIPDYGTDKINASFAVGGAPLLAQTVEQATGVRLDHYAEVEFDGFARLVDAVGGVTMCPPEPISDPLAGIDLPAGCQKLDGRNALGYVRTRATPRADLDRMVNQRQFMSTLVHRAASPSVVLNPIALVPDGQRRRRLADRRLWRACVGPRPVGVGAARRHHHDDRADRRIHRQRLGFRRRVGRGRRRPVVRRAQVGHSRSAGCA